MVFPSSHVWMGELDHKESWVTKDWFVWTVVLEKTLKSPVDCKEVQPVHPKGDQSWMFTGRTDAEAETPILWPPDGKNCRRRERLHTPVFWPREFHGLYSAWVTKNQTQLCHICNFIYTFSLCVLETKRGHCCTGCNWDLVLLGPFSGQKREILCVYFYTHT